MCTMYTSCVWYVMHHVYVYGIMVCMISWYVYTYIYGMCVCISTPCSGVGIYGYCRYVPHVLCIWHSIMCTMYTSCVWYVIHHVYMYGITVCDIMVCVYIHIYGMYVCIYYTPYGGVYVPTQGRYVPHILCMWHSVMCTMYTSCVWYVIHHVYAMVSWYAWYHGMCIHTYMVCVYAYPHHVVV